MVMTADEASALIATRDRTGRLLVVAFQGSLSPQVRRRRGCSARASSGAILNINAVVWQDWATLPTGTWRQEPALSGGGFLFDTGAHMLNTVADLAGEDFAEVAAWLEDDGRPVDIRAVVMGRLASGALVTMNACGSAIPSLPLRHPRVRDQGDPADRGLGRAPRAPAAGAEPPCREVRSVARAVWEQFLERPCRPRAQSQPARGRPAHGPAVGCDPRVAGARRRRRASRHARGAAMRGGRHGDPRDRLERVPPGALRRRRRRRSTRTASTARSPPACASAAASTSGRRRSTSPSTA